MKLSAPLPSSTDITDLHFQCILTFAGFFNAALVTSNVLVTMPTVELTGMHIFFKTPKPCGLKKSSWCTHIVLNIL